MRFYEPLIFLLLVLISFLSVSTSAETISSKSQSLEEFLFDSFSKCDEKIVGKILSGKISIGLGLRKFVSGEDVGSLLVDYEFDTSECLMLVTVPRGYYYFNEKQNSAEINCRHGLASSGYKIDTRVFPDGSEFYVKEEKSCGTAGCKYYIYYSNKNSILDECGVKDEL